MLRVTLRPSRSLAAVLAAAHLACAVLLVPLDLPLWVKCALAAAIALSLTSALRRHALRLGRSALVALELRGEDRAAVQTRDGEWRDARVLPTTYVSPVLTIVNLRSAQRLRPYHAVIIPDSVRAEDFRALRVWLRWRYRRSG